MTVRGAVAHARAIAAHLADRAGTTAVDSAAAAVVVTARADAGRAGSGSAAGVACRTYLTRGASPAVERPTAAVGESATRTGGAGSWGATAAGCRAHLTGGAACAAAGGAWRGARAFAFDAGHIWPADSTARTAVGGAAVHINTNPVAAGVARTTPVTAPPTVAIGGDARTGPTTVRLSAGTDTGGARTDATFGACYADATATGEPVAALGKR